MTHLDRVVRVNAQVLLSMVGGIREGNADAIHAARVATRRLRAALPIAWSNRTEQELANGRRTLRRIARALGRARDVDVALDILGGMELKVPGSHAAILGLRAELTSRQWREQRRLIKRLENLGVLEVSTSSRFERILPAIEWRTDRRWLLLEDVLLRHAERLRDSVVAATGVYFPNRTHFVRIQTKRLRYLLELVPTEPPELRGAAKRLRRVQEVLGALNDRQTVADLVDEADEASGNGEGREQYDALRSWLTADARELHRKYLEHRENLVAVCEAVEKAVVSDACRPPTVGRALAAIGALTAPAAAALLKRHLVSSLSKAEHAKGTRFDGTARDAEPGTTAELLESRRQ